MTKNVIQIKNIEKTDISKIYKYIVHLKGTLISLFSYISRIYRKLVQYIVN